MALSKKLNGRDTARLASMRVLLADDHPHIRSIISGILNALSMSSIETTERGDRALQLLSTGNYDLFITDYEMPGLSGIEVARQLRKEARASEPKPSFDIPILMITSNVTRQRLNDVRDAGIDEILAKPFTITAVSDRLNAIINNRRPFIVCDTYVGPCRRRGFSSGYTGALRRDTDLEQLPDAEITQERALLGMDARAIVKLSQDCDTIAALEREVVMATALQMAQRTKRLRVPLLERAAQSLVKYVQWAATTSRVDAQIVETHGQTVIELLELSHHDAVLSEQIAHGLETAVAQRMGNASRV
jgi:two-component system, chemotaxis family, chemotaxis protein CheY